MITARVIAPSRSLAALRDWHGFTDEDVARAAKRLRDRGVAVTFGANIEQSGPDGTAPIRARLEDLHDAYADDDIQLVLALSGGAGAIQLLPELDYELIARHPKPLVGYSDIGYLHLALLARIGRTGHYGPNFASFADASEHSLNGLPTSELWCIRPGEAEGRSVGGSAHAVQMLKGSDLLPPLEGAILFLESPGHGKATAMELDANLRSLALFEPQVRGIVLGKHDRLPREEVERVVSAVDWDVPVIANAAFGHCTPRGMVPIGQRCTLRTDGTVSLAFGK